MAIMIPAAKKSRVIRLAQKAMQVVQGPLGATVGTHGAMTFLYQHAHF